MGKQILLIRDAAPFSPVHFLHRALEEEGVDVCPIYIDRFRRTYQFGNRLPGVRARYPELYFGESMNALRNWGRFDLVLVADHVRVPASIVRRGDRSALWAIDPELRPDNAELDARRRYNDLPRFDLIFNDQPTMGGWMKEAYPSSKIHPLALAAPRHLYQDLSTARPHACGFVGLVKTSERRREFLVALQKLVPGFLMTEHDTFLPPLTYSRAMRSLAVCAHRSAGHEVATRVFEALAAGCLLVADDVKDLRSLVGDELYRTGIITYNDWDDPHEAAEKVLSAVERASADPALHARIHALAMRDHTYHSRAREILRVTGLA